MTGFTSFLSFPELLMKIIRVSEFTCRYEYLEDLNKNGNIGRFYTPMLSYVIGDDYTSKISLVGVISDYSKDIINTNQYSSKLLLLQYQIRF